MTQRYSGLILLILAGELIFSLPFHITRFFKSGVLEVFQISNTNLGDAFAFYGILALLSYFPGGYLADRYPPRKLIFYSLLFTGIGGIYFATIPKPTMLPYLYAFWGITTILFFWGALIKYTSDWGGMDQQGRAFGYLEAGRALVASIFSSIAFLLVYLFSQDSESFSRNSIQLVILFYAITTIVLSFLVLFFLRDKIKKRTSGSPMGASININYYPVFLISIIVICAYCGFRSIDNISLYLVEIGNLTPIEASGFVTLLSYLRIISALAAGFIADKLTSIKLIIRLFIIIVLGQSILFSIHPQTFYHSLLVTGTLIVVFISIVALRAVYFSLITHSHIPSHRIGFCVGIISLVGFTPDIFFHSLTGRILDAEPGIIGFQNYYLVTMLISILGLLASLKLSRWISSKNSLKDASRTNN